MLLGEFLTSIFLNGKPPNWFFKGNYKQANLAN